MYRGFRSLYFCEHLSLWKPWLCWSAGQIRQRARQWEDSAICETAREGCKSQSKWERWIIPSRVECERLNGRDQWRESERAWGRTSGVWTWKRIKRTRKTVCVCERVCYHLSFWGKGPIPVCVRRGLKFKTFRKSIALKKWADRKCETVWSA